MLGNKYIAVLVGILLVLVLAYNFKFFFSKNRAPEVTGTERSKVVQHSEPVQHPEPDRKMKPERFVEKEDRNSWKRDPFGLQALPKKTVTKKIEIGEGIHLMGIIKRDGRSHVLINGKVYGVNDKVGDVVIKDIKDHGIVLFSDGKSQEISFEDYIVLKERTK